MLSPRDKLFFKAVLDQDAPVLLRLLADGASPEAATQDGLTALCLAAAEGAVESLGILLEAGADPDRMDDPNGMSALMTAAFEGRQAAVARLIESRAWVDLAAADGTTALMYAALQGRTAIVGMLIAAGADVMARTQRGSTALVLALQGAHADAAAMLRSAGAETPEDGERDPRDGGN